MTDPNLPSTGDTRFERTKYFIDLAKWFIVSVALVVVTLIIDSGFKDRAAGIQEIQQYDKYVTDLIVLNKEVAPRRLLAQYFANVTASDKLRERWRDYFKTVDGEYQQYLHQDSTVKAALVAVALKYSDTLKVAPEEKVKIQNLQTKANEINRQLNPNIKLPANSSVTVKAVSLIFNTASDDKDFDTRISVVLKTASGQIVSTASYNDNVEFKELSVHSYELPMAGSDINKNDILNGSLTIQIEPKGHDTWQFTPTLKMQFSDGSELVQNNFNLVNLNQDQRQITLSF